MYFLLVVIDQFKDQVKLFLRRTEGASAIEYAVLVAMVALVLIGLMSGFKTDIEGIFNKISTAINPST